MGLLQVLWLVLPANLSARQVAATLVAVMIPIERRGEGAKDTHPGFAPRKSVAIALSGHFTPV